MSNVLTGSKAQLRIGATKVGYVGGINITQDDTLTDIDVLDQLEVAEHAETGHKVSFSCNMFKVSTNSLRALNIRTSNIRDVLTQPELSMDVYNSVGERVEYSMTGVKFEGGSGSVDARGVWNGTWNFKARLGGFGAGDTNSL